MVLASHVILGAYGFWLPNDPRGSWSTFVGAWDLYRCAPSAGSVSRRTFPAAFSIKTLPTIHNRRPFSRDSPRSDLVCALRPRSSPSRG